MHNTESKEQKNKINDVRRTRRNNEKPYIVASNRIVINRMTCVLSSEDRFYDWLYVYEKIE